MMEITRNVILDLLPLYIAGEASPDTQTLVEEYLQNDPQLAKMAEQSDSLHQLDDIPVPLTKEAEMEAYKEAKQMQFQRIIIWAVVIAALILAFLGCAATAAFFLISV